MDSGLAISNLRAQTYEWMRQSLAPIRQSDDFCRVSNGAVCRIIYSDNWKAVADPSFAEVCTHAGGPTGKPARTTNPAAGNLAI